MSLPHHIFEIYRALLYKESGLVVTPEKVYLLETRLMPIVRKNGFSGLEDMAPVLTKPENRSIMLSVIEAMTTNETSFFRDVKIYDRFNHIVLPDMVEKRKDSKSLRIWSSACSTGQEPYSVGMSIKEKPEFNAWNIEILATDISPEVLAYSKNGVYSQFEIQRGLPISHHVKYFSEAGEKKWAINDDIKGMMRFKEFNLLSSMRLLGTFDIIFCRNVLIYFDEQTKAGVLERMAGQLSADGCLLLGGAETVIGVTDCFKPVAGAAGLYVKNAGPGRECVRNAPPAGEAVSL